MNPQDPSKDAAPQPQPDRQPPEPEHSTAHHPAEAAAPASAPAGDTESRPSDEPEHPLYHAEDDSSAPDTDAEARQYTPQIPDAAPAPHPHHTGSVEWTASEFVAHDKDPQWFAGLAGVTLAVAALVFLITRDIFSTVVVCIAGVMFGVVARRPPRQMRYIIDDHGVSIGAKDYPYTDFRSFSVLQEGPLRSITFMPLKRFMPPLSMYYDPADEDKIAEVLSAHLPMQDHQHDPIDKLMKWVRF